MTKRYVDDISPWHHQIHLIDGMMTQGLRDNLLGPPASPVFDGRHQCEGRREEVLHVSD